MNVELRENWINGDSAISSAKRFSNAFDSVALKSVDPLTKVEQSGEMDLKLSVFKIGTNLLMKTRRNVSKS